MNLHCSIFYTYSFQIGGNQIHTVKQHLKCADEITKENLDNSVNSTIIKSASTPASLQAVVRFQNGSNMSLQHKVSHKIYHSTENL